MLKVLPSNLDVLLYLSNMEVFVGYYLFYFLMKSNYQVCVFFFRTGEVTDTASFRVTIPKQAIIGEIYLL